MKRLSAQAINNKFVAVLGPGETVPERARHTIQDRKSMVTIAWNPLGFPWIVALPKGAPLTPSTIMIISLQHWLSSSQRTTGENSLFILTMQGLTLLKNVELFAKKMDCGSLPIIDVM
jgi:hypothetical protein